MARTDATHDEPADAKVSVLVEDLHVRYRVYEEHRLTASDLLKRGFRSRASVDVHALKGVNLRIDVGESVGLVGANGSGKSTLLRCIAGVESTDSGRVLVRGRAQLLAVNAALDPQLSGKRNVILGGLAMGMSLDEVNERLPSVIEFSGLERAIDRPMRTYSSGMRARLSFSIATMHQPPILLIDEALAVGDRKFRAKSLARVRQIKAEARTVVMVTHNLAEIRNTCARTVWLDDGLIVADGETETVLEAYEAEDFSAD